jgi:polysaccharide pyruvyl transferase WcaK-like protein
MAAAFLFMINSLTRPHSVIFATACDVPFVTIAYDLKLMGIAESFKMENHALDIIGIDSDILVSKLEQVWKERYKIKMELNQRITELKQTG